MTNGDGHEKTFGERLTDLVNEYGIDSQYTIPDYIISNYLLTSLKALMDLKTQLLEHKIGES